MSPSHLSPLPQSPLFPGVTPRPFLPGDGCRARILAVFGGDVTMSQGRAPGDSVPQRYGPGPAPWGLRCLPGRTFGMEWQTAAPALGERGCAWYLLQHMRESCRTAETKTPRADVIEHGSNSAAYPERAWAAVASRWERLHPEQGRRKDALLVPPNVPVLEGAAVQEDLYQTQAG